MKRPTWSEYYLDIAEVVSQRSTCRRRQYGCVIVKDNRIIATGYNGSPEQEVNCCDSEICYRQANNVPPGEQYEKCCAVHAEMNALISANRADLIGSDVYLYGRDDNKVIKATPCNICRQMLMNSGVARIIGGLPNESHTT